jgi:ABC-type uncharacterized transport system ATPase subunit
MDESRLGDRQLTPTKGSIVMITHRLAEARQQVTMLTIRPRRPGDVHSPGSNR